MDIEFRGNGMRENPSVPGTPPGTTLVAIGLALTGALAELAEIVILLVLLVSLSTDLSVLILRRDEVAQDHFPTWDFKRGHVI